MNESKEKFIRRILPYMLGKHGAAGDIKRQGFLHMPDLRDGNGWE